jgi:peptide/nickel transport system permease protein
MADKKRVGGVLSAARRSRGVQRFMLMVGLVLSAFFLLLAVLAPLIAPYGFAELKDANGYFGAQQAPSSQHLFGTTVGGMETTRFFTATFRTPLQL